MKLLPLIILLAICTAFPAYAVQRNLEVTWELTQVTGVTPAGYRLYLVGQNDPVCTTDDADATSLPCSLDLEGNSATFTLTSYAATGEESPKSAPFTYTFVPAESLHAAFSCNPTSGQAPLPVTCNAAASTGNIVSYSWSFGDGSQGSGQTIDHRYAQPGNYPATLTVTSATGETDSSTILISASHPDPDNHSPNAVIKATPVNGQSPLLVHFDASDSTDPDGDTLTYSWTFGDNTQGTGKTTTHTYTTPGLYTAKLRVTDEHNASTVTTVPIMVNKPSDDTEQPLAKITIRHPRIIPVELPFLISGEHSESSTGEEDIIRYQWDLGDGTTAAGKQLMHSYDTTGEFTISLTVQDASGKSAQTQKTVRVVSREELNKILSVQQLIYRLLLKKKPAEDMQQTDNQVN